MKPTDKQKAFCDLIARHAEYWKRTNDISSPTHGSDLYNDLLELELEVPIGSYDKHLFFNKLIELHGMICSFEPKPKIINFEKPKNKICVNCKTIYSIEPEVCKECGGKTFENTMAEVKPTTQ